MATDLFRRMQYGYKPDLDALTDKIDLRWIRMQTEWLALIKAAKGEENHTLQTKIRKFEEILESELEQARLAKIEPLEAREYVY